MEQARRGKRRVGTILQSAVCHRPCLARGDVAQREEMSFMEPRAYRTSTQSGQGSRPDAPHARVSFRQSAEVCNPRSSYPSHLFLSGHGPRFPQYGERTLVSTQAGIHRPGEEIIE